MPPRRSPRTTSVKGSAAAAVATPKKEAKVKGDKGDKETKVPKVATSSDEDKAKRATTIGKSSKSLCYCRQCKGVIIQTKALRGEHYDEYGWCTTTEKNEIIKDKRKATRGEGIGAGRDRDTKEANVEDEEGDEYEGDDIGKDESRDEKKITMALAKKGSDNNDEVMALRAQVKELSASMTTMKKDLASVSSSSSAKQSSSSSSSLSSSHDQLLLEVLKNQQDPERASHDQLMKLRLSLVEKAHAGVMTTYRTYRAWANEQLKEDKWNNPRNYHEYITICDLLDLMIANHGFKSDNEVVRSAVLRLLTITQADQTGNWRHAPVYGGAGCERSVIPSTMMAALEKKASDYISTLDKLGAGHGYGRDRGHGGYAKVKSSTTITPRGGAAAAARGGSAKHHGGGMQRGHGGYGGQGKNKKGNRDNNDEM